MARERVAVSTLSTWSCCMNTYEDDEFERIEMEIKLRQREPSPIPLITDEEWEALNEEEK